MMENSENELIMSAMKLKLGKTDDRDPNAQILLGLLKNISSLLEELRSEDVRHRFIAPLESMDSRSSSENITTLEGMSLIVAILQTYDMAVIIKIILQPLQSDTLYGNTLLVIKHKMMISCLKQKVKMASRNSMMTATPTSTSFSCSHFTPFL